TGTAAGLPQLSGQRIHPYTDLLLHDMGEGLADHRPDYLASGSEWRTQPLWGIGLVQKTTGTAYYLHDGRARTVEEAILWHGGEAQKSRGAFLQLSSAERNQLLKFLSSL
ncbi:MAG TPA: di-heme oxidoredictase family protein, partial [Puia sp.]